MKKAQNTPNIKEKNKIKIKMMTKYIFKDISKVFRNKINYKL